MGKLFNINETAQRLGVTEQTIRNWIDKGAISVKKVGKARYIDENTINALQDTAEDITRQQKALEKLLEEVRKERELREAERYEQKFRSRYTNLMVGAAFRNDFFGIMVHLLVMYGSIDARQGAILAKFLNGHTLESIAEDYGLTRERIRQIVEKAIRKSRDLTGIEELLDKAKKTEEENTRLKAVVSRLTEQLNKYESVTAFDDDHKREVKQLYDILSTKIVECQLSVRAINCLHIGDSIHNIQSCKTVGDVCRINKIDILKMRNAGKKTLREIEDFLGSKGLSFGMDVDKIYAEYLVIKNE